MILFKDGLWGSILKIIEKVLAFFGISFFKKKRENEERLIKAIEESNFDEVKKLKDLGVNINLKDKNGKTMLMNAVDKNDSVIVELLLGGNGDDEELFLKNNIKIDTEIKDSSGETVLMRAVRNCDPDMVGILIEHGANVLAKNKNGETVQKIAYKCKNEIINGEKYKYIFSEIETYVTERSIEDRKVIFNYILGEKENYEKKVQELNEKITDYENNTNYENKKHELKDEKKKNENILYILKEQNKFMEVLEKVERYEDIESILTTHLELSLLDDKNYNIDISDKFLNKKKNENLVLKILAKIFLRIARFLKLDKSDNLNIKKILTQIERFINQDEKGNLGKEEDKSLSQDAGDGNGILFNSDSKEDINKNLGKKGDGSPRQDIGNGNEVSLYPEKNQDENDINKQF